MPLRLSIVILTLFLCGLWSGGGAALASGAVSGVLLSGTAQFHREVDDEEVQSVTTNYQQASLRYDARGVIGDARLGNYSLMLGYEINRIAPSVTNYGVRDPDIKSITAKKPFYEASLLLAPGGLPFRLSLYGRDLHRSVFVDEGLNGNIPAGSQAFNPTRVLNTKIFTGIENGTRRELGGTFLLGIRNGSYLGAYRNVLSQLPRLLVDYKQVVIRDLARDRNRQHNRTRDLAFVSLNKLDNWVHFRMRDHSDFLNPENDRSHKQVIIGLIDQVMERKWINFTNWLKVSSDFSYTVDNEIRQPDPEKNYVLNMMAVGNRQNFNTTVFSTFSRTTNGQNAEIAMELPIATTIDLNRDTRFRSRVIYEANQRSLLEGIEPISHDNPDTFFSADVSTRDCYLDLQLETLRSRSIVVVPRLEVEERSERNSRGWAMRAGSEVYNKRKLANALSWLGGYDLTVISSEGGNGDERGRYLENKIYGRVDKEFNRNLLVGGNATLASGRATGQDLIGFRIPRMSAQLQVGGGSGKDVAASSDVSNITSSTFTLYFEHRFQQLKNRLEVSYEALTAESGTISQIALRHNLDYTQRIHSFKWTSEVNQGDNSGAPSTSFDYVAVSASDGSASKLRWASEANYSYAPTRTFALSLDGTVNGGGGEQQVTYKFSEKMDYRLFTTNGIIRRIAEFSEELGYEKAGAAQNGRDSSIYGLFTAAYYPTRVLYCKLSSQIVSYPGSSALQQVNIGEVGLDFEKLKLMASYSEGKRNRESAVLPEVMERLWNIEVQKFF